jgi:hypothetical protein
MTDVEKFYERCGKILRMRAAIESYLELFLSHYFQRPKSYKIDMDFTKMPFERKKFLLGKLCEREEVEPKTLEKLMSSINTVQKIGNSVAHHDSVIFDKNHPNIFMQPKARSIEKKDLIEVADELVDKVESAKIEAFKEMNKLYGEFQKKRNI